MKKKAKISGYTPEQVREIEKAFEKNDITKDFVPLEKSSFAPDKAEIFVRTQRIFESYWKTNLRGFGISKNMKYFSDNYPLKILMNFNSDSVSEIVSDIRLNDFSDGDGTDCIDTFFNMYSGVIMTGLEGHSRNLGKEISELTDDEIMSVVGKVADIINEELSKVLMIGNKIPAVYNIVSSNKAIDDFDFRKGNPEKKDFLRAYYHRRYKGGADISYEDLDESDLMSDDIQDIVERMSEEEFSQKLSDFLNTLDDVDRTIFQMRIDNCTLQQIAEKLGYKTHSAVKKRLDKHRARTIEYFKGCV